MTQFNDPRIDPRRLGQPRLTVQDPLRWQPIYPPPDQAQVEPQCRRSRLAGIVALILLIVAGLIGLKFLSEIAGFLSTMKNIGPSHSFEEQTVGLVAFGLTAICILAAVKICQSSTDSRSR